MISAVFGCSGRTDATHAALILADAHAALGEAVTVLRVTLPGEAGLPRKRIRPDEVTLVELDVTAVDGLAHEVAGVVAGPGHVVLDLPARCLADTELRRRIDVPVMVVGPSPLDEHMAAFALPGIESGVTGIPDGPPPVWLLGCGRAGGTAAAGAFAVAMRRLAVAEGSPAWRVLPVAVPSLSRLEATRVTEGDRTARTLEAGLPLLAALRIVSGAPRADAVNPRAYAEALVRNFTAARQPDRREAGERLRDLADELQGIADGAKPDGDDLAEAPRLEGWRTRTREVRILTGRAYGHPDIPDGRRITTSDLYASDGATWARTMSRYWRLGTPAAGRPMSA